MNNNINGQERTEMTFRHFKNINLTQSAIQHFLLTNISNCIICWILHLEWSNARHKEINPEKSDLGMVASRRLSGSQRCPGSPEGKPQPGAHQTLHDPRVKRDNYPAVLSVGMASPGALCAVLISMSLRIWRSLNESRGEKKSYKIFLLLCICPNDIHLNFSMQQYNDTTLRMNPCQICNLVSQDFCAMIKNMHSIDS